MRHDWTRFWHRLFTIGIAIKGLDGMAEMLGGGALLLTTRPQILWAVSALTRGELLEDPGDFIANHLLRLARNLSIGTREFGGLYLLVQGTAKLIMAIGLLRDERWAYPVSIAMLSALLAYQCVRIWQTAAIPLIALTLFDLVFVGLIGWEWRRRRRLGRQRV
ncbi:MAG: DUF2127 domain-containing protein [Steroidobacteraceae bacterium]|nr:DUF2127 domain-containing protein [Steroidobacteraceae bacterium]